MCPERQEPIPPEGDSLSQLRNEAAQAASKWIVTGRSRAVMVLETRLSKATEWIERAQAQLEAARAEGSLVEDQVWLVENTRLLKGAAQNSRQGLAGTGDIPMVRGTPEAAVPRCYVAAKAYLVAVAFDFDEASLVAYFQGAQQQSPFESDELWAAPAFLQLSVLEEIGRLARSEVKSLGQESVARPAKAGYAKLITSLRKIKESDWKELFEHLSVVEEILRTDPAGTYPQMDADSREYYRGVIKDLAAHSDGDEFAVAHSAIALAGRASLATIREARIRERRRHVGYYLAAAGRKELEQEIRFRPPVRQRLRDFIERRAAPFYLCGIALFTLATITFAMGGIQAGLPLILGVMVLLIPASEAATGMMNQLVAFLVTPRPLPKLDFSAGIPSDCTTMVAVPAVLGSEQQTRELVRDLEIRHLANRDPHLHFALLTDLPDSPQEFDEKDQLAQLCSDLISDLNRKYGAEGKGGFFHFHRHRVYNPTEGAWIGWERKRGKLHDLNNLLRGGFDSFPVKKGDLSVLPAVRYVITLDADTQLPPNSARKLIGTLAHPLNQAIVDPATNTVVEGYGVLQPRVGISVRSANRSRLASIYSGQTGFDIYTRAISDIYQDLFGEGIFTGKGIYEVEAFQTVLCDRFPTNAILSHDLIEGNYARAGLVTDIEVIDDYPSNFSAYSRRKHRWVRGDWQILRWLLPRVPSYSGKLVPNPLNLVSRWKILDNLRRSVVEIALFVLLMGAWFFLPGSPARWATTAVVLLLLPAYFELLLALVRLLETKERLPAIEQTVEAFVAGQVNVFLLFVFLAHQMLVTADAVVRTLIRTTLTHRKLLEWETAAQAELQRSTKTRVDFYLDLTPYLAVGLAILLALLRPAALSASLPILALWALSKPLAQLLNRPSLSGTDLLSNDDKAFLRGVAARTWHFFRTARSEEDHGLIPDNIQDDPPDIAHRISPTNLGFLFNAQVAALKLGYLTVPEFAGETEAIMRVAHSLPRFRGHFLNWYDTRTLKPEEPHFVSSVDSGNLVCCLWTLQHGCESARTQVLLGPELMESVRDHAQVVAEIATATLSGPQSTALLPALIAEMGRLGSDVIGWHRCFCRLEAVLRDLTSEAARLRANNLELEDLRSWIMATQLRIHAIRDLAQQLTPWLLPEFQSLVQNSSLRRASGQLAAPTLSTLARVISDLEAELKAILQDGGSTHQIRSLAEALHLRLTVCAATAADLDNRLEHLAASAAVLAKETDFRFLYDARRKALSIGYTVGREQVEDSCYDMLASEARTAVFVAIAKGDIPLESWLQLGRLQTLYHRHRVLLSWTGTMFEYLMPGLWMRSYPRTLLEHSARIAVFSQQNVVRRLGIPWGISESAYADREPESRRYQYRAFGMQGLAVSLEVPDRLVISPYASCLALTIDPRHAVENLRHMQGMGWLGSSGFYESADMGNCHDFEVVRTRMAHHQGMVLLSICNLLLRSVMQDLFHQEPLVEAAERILYERVPLPVHLERRDSRHYDQFCRARRRCPPQRLKPSLS
jgi:hypothetical protein